MSDSTAKSTQLTDVIAQLVQDGVEFFLNSQLHPTVLIPDDAFQKEWPADGQRVQDLLTKVHYEISKDAMTKIGPTEPVPLLRSTEREFLLSMIREECRLGGRRLTEVEAEETDQDPIVQALLYHLNDNEGFEGRTSALLGTLRKYQLENKVSQAEEIPVFANIFSRRLKRLIPTLRGYGVEIAIEHQEAGSYCTMKRLESFRREQDATDATADGNVSESSGQSSGATPKKGSNLQRADGTDGENRFDSPDAKKKLNLAKGAGKEVKGERTTTAASGDPEPTTVVEPVKGGE
jgi:hypothetical protein